MKRQLNSEMRSPLKIDREVIMIALMLLEIKR